MQQRVVFYCHFPDLLLTQRDNLLKSFYRLPIDWIEEVTTGFADEILVNSRFTGQLLITLFRPIHYGVNWQMLSHSYDSFPKIHLATHYFQRASSMIRLQG